MNRVYKIQTKTKTRLKQNYPNEYIFSLEVQVFTKEMNSLYIQKSPAPKAHKGLGHQFSWTSKKYMRSIFNNDDLQS